VTQFLRIATEAAPDLRGSGISDDIAAVVEKAMSRDPHDRPPPLDTIYLPLYRTFNSIYRT